MIPIRDEKPSKHFPVITVSLILINTFIFILERFIKLDLAELAGFVPIKLSKMQPVSLLLIFTSMFLHGNFFHLAGNMLYLWIFGDNVEDRMGHIHFLFFYIIGGVIADIIYTAFAIHSNIPLIGASGAISAVMGAYLIFFPKSRVLVLIPIPFFIRILSMPGIIFLTIWLLIQFVNLPAGGDIAFSAHIGGFFAGLLLAKAFEK